MPLKILQNMCWCFLQKINTEGAGEFLPSTLERSLHFDCLKFIYIYPQPNLTAHYFSSFSPFSVEFSSVLWTKEPRAEQDKIKDVCAQTMQKEDIYFLLYVRDCFG